MSIYLVRHADKEVGDFHSIKLPMNDQPISARGIIQSEWLDAYFSEIDISRIYVSEYKRTGQTIAKVLHRKGLIPITDGRLNEINVGDTESMSDIEIEQKYPEFWKSFKQRTNDFRFPNGESGDEAGNRIFEIFNEVPKNENVIFVAHDGIIRILICMILSMPTYNRRKFKIDLASITKCDYDNELKSWRIAFLNYQL